MGRGGFLNRNWTELFNELCAGGTCQTFVKGIFYTLDFEEQKKNAHGYRLTISPHTLKIRLSVNCLSLSFGIPLGVCLYILL